jgi:hypothetical protein
MGGHQTAAGRLMLTILGEKSFATQSRGKTDITEKRQHFRLDPKLTQTNLINLLRSTGGRSGS